MDLADLLDQIRTHYLSLFENEIAVVRASGRRVVPEFAMEEGGRIVRDGAFAGTRCDALVLEGGGATPMFFPFDRMIGFSPAAFDIGGMPFTLAPIHWYGVNVQVGGDPDVLIDALAGWFEGAFASASENWDERLKLAAHDVSDVAVRDGNLHCKIDFGTMPASAVGELLDALRLAGASNVGFGFGG